jgi:fructose-1,6-bisphosphatase/inositol monophosphatase family enzyme
MMCAERGQGAFWNGEPMAAIPPGEIKSSSLVSVNERVKRDLPGKPRLSGAFVIDGAFTVRQYYRALFAVNEKLYDIASSVLAARELGATIAFLDGEPFNEFDWVKDEKIDRPWGIFPAGSQLF